MPILFPKVCLSNAKKGQLQGIHDISELRPGDSVNDIHDKLDRTVKPGLPSCYKNEDGNAE